MRPLLIAACLFFSVAAHSQAQPDYRLGPSDTVRVVVYNNPDLTTEAQVAEDGTIAFPLTGPVGIGGLGRTQAEAAIAKRLVDGGFLRNAQVNLTVVSFASQQVSVLGEVGKPGRYPIRGRTTIIDVIAEAGGISEKGSHKVALVRRDDRGNTTRTTIDLGALGNAGSISIPTMQRGDIVLVAPSPVFYVYGEVQKPGAYPLAPDMTVRQAIATGGGLTLRGTERGLRVDRRDGEGVIHSARIGANDPVREDDVIHVKESFF